MTPKACEHIMDSGRNCASPRLNGGRFCYWHNRLHTQHHFPGNPNYEPPILDSANAVALALNHIYRGQSRGLIDGKTARPLQQSLRLALQAYRLLDRPLPDKMVTDLPCTADPRSAGDSPAVAPSTSAAPSPASLCTADTPLREAPPEKRPPAGSNNHQSSLSSPAFSLLADSRATTRLTPEQERNIANLVRRSAG